MPKQTDDGALVALVRGMSSSTPRIAMSVEDFTELARLACRVLRIGRAYSFREYDSPLDAQADLRGLAGLTQGVNYAAKVLSLLVFANASDDGVDLCELGSLGCPSLDAWHVAALVLHGVAQQRPGDYCTLALVVAFAPLATDPDEKRVWADLCALAWDDVDSSDESPVVHAFFRAWVAVDYGQALVTSVSDGYGYPPALKTKQAISARKNARKNHMCLGLTIPFDKMPVVCIFQLLDKDEGLKAAMRACRTPQEASALLGAALTNKRARVAE